MANPFDVYNRSSTSTSSALDEAKHDEKTQRLAPTDLHVVFNGDKATFDKQTAAFRAAAAKVTSVRQLAASLSVYEKQRGVFLGNTFENVFRALGALYDAQTRTGGKELWRIEGPRIRGLALRFLKTIVVSKSSSELMDALDATDWNTDARLWRQPAVTSIANEHNCKGTERLALQYEGGGWLSNSVSHIRKAVLTLAEDICVQPVRALNEGRVGADGMAVPGDPLPEPVQLEQVLTVLATGAMKKAEERQITAWTKPTIMSRDLDDAEKMKLAEAALHAADYYVKNNDTFPAWITAYEERKKNRSRKRKRSTTSTLPPASRRRVVSPPHLTGRAGSSTDLVTPDSDSADSDDAAPNTVERDV